MSDEIETGKAAGVGGLVVGTGSLLVWVLAKLFKPSEDAAIRQAKLEERLDNFKEKLEERINGVAATQSVRISALEIQNAQLKEKIFYLESRMAEHEENDAKE